MARPHTAEYMQYGGYFALSESGAADNMLSRNIPAGDADEVIFINRLAYNIGHSGTEASLKFIYPDGSEVYPLAALGTTDTLVEIVYDPPIVTGIQGSAAAIIATNTELSVGVIYVQGRRL
jgi:hypothetical protein